MKDIGIFIPAKVAAVVVLKAMAPDGATAAIDKAKTSEMDNFLEFINLPFFNLNY